MVFARGAKPEHEHSGGHEQAREDEHDQAGFGTEASAVVAGVAGRVDVGEVATDKGTGECADCVRDGLVLGTVVTGL